jgi:uncharacterized glyoxalase superfamily protein PhnB
MTQPSSRPPVSPYLTVTPAAAAIAFYVAAFGAVQKALMPALDGVRILHCELAINGGTVMLSDAFMEYGKISPRRRSVSSSSRRKRSTTSSAARPRWGRRRRWGP